MDESLNAQPPQEGKSAYDAYYAQQPQPVQYAYAAPAPAPAKKGSHGWIVGLVAILAIAAIVMVAITSCTGMLSGVAGPASEYASVSQPSVAVIEMRGTIQSDGTSCSPEGLKSLLKQAAKEDNIKAVVLHVDSGGGYVTPSEEMGDLVRDFEKPIVVSSAGMNASGAYWISSQSDFIFVDKTTEIGSIGVILQKYNIEELLDKLGIEIETVKSAESKDAGSIARPLTKEEREWFQKELNAVCDLFIQVVADGRKMSIDDVKKLATGQTYLGMDAVNNGLADEIGTLDDATKKASELAGENDLPATSLSKNKSELSSLIDLLGKSGSIDESDKSHSSAKGLMLSSDSMQDLDRELEKYASAE